MSKPSNTTIQRRSAQKGAVLLIAMVMLLMIMLITTAVIRLTMSHTEIVNNDQVRMEAKAAANFALDSLLNTPVDQWPASGSAATTEYVNLGTSGTTDGDVAQSIAVSVTAPKCKRSRVIKSAELIKKTGAFYYVNATDTVCFGGGGSPITIVDPTALGAPNGDSLCATVLYEATATPNDAKLLGANLSVTQGVEVRRAVDEVVACN